jgi:hypothetical protein
MTKLKIDRRSGVERREFQYTEYIPERRSDIDRRCVKKWKKNLWAKYADTSRDCRKPKICEFDACKLLILLRAKLIKSPFPNFIQSKSL